MFAGTGFCLPENSGKWPALPGPIYPCNCCLVLVGFSARVALFVVRKWKKFSTVHGVSTVHGYCSRGAVHRHCSHTEG
ncbi:hypothetical protein SLEP1_g53035 [Rubroshorea leprosula]|uniref:Uncharacterized protein n=1 Tax=Rubroshorea leprosula TaxID=152421 RepID=A0AAV5M857_9ROSI|nr:hypothetical protein SLEP1_g53035 [Rubroshorea leprosula]